MGQTSSGDRVPEWSDVQRHAASIKELALFSYDHFASSLKELNTILQKFPDANGKHLLFAVKRGTDSTLLWKATVKIGCVRVIAGTKKVDSYRLLNLKQYLQVYHMIMCQAAAQIQKAGVAPGVEANECDTCECADDSDAGKSSDLDKPDGAATKVGFTFTDPFTTSMILERVTEDLDQPQSLEECCICMERKPEVILPCAHNYCVPCIEQWNVSSKTCPVCREEIESTDDSWVISEAPESSEIEAEVQKLLSGLSLAQNAKDG